MKELEIECHKLGIPVKTRHNEVAPNQFELAPIFENANLANDHNQLVMDLMKRIARKHHFAVLLHEKPYNGVKRLRQAQQLVALHRYGYQICLHRARIRKGTCCFPYLPGKRTDDGIQKTRTCCAPPS